MDLSIRLVACVLSPLLLLSAGCGSAGPGRSSGNGTARTVLLAVAVGSAAVAIGSAFVSANKESSLRDDLAAGKVTGSDYNERNASGLRWNRFSRASVFIGGLSLVGMGLLWEMGVGENLRNGAYDEKKPGSVGTPPPVSIVAPAYFPTFNRR